MRRKLLAATLLVVVGVLGFTGLASAADGTAETTVTIQAEGRDLFGYVNSPAPLRCAEGREVKVFKVTRDGDRTFIGLDDASWNGERYMWSLGNTGLTGRFFARAITGCEGDKSETILVR